MTLEQPETIQPLTYQPRSREIGCVAEAIRLFRQTVRNDDLVDHRWNVGFAEGVANAMALCDPWCQDAEDRDLWRQCAQMHDARPADDMNASLRRKRAWFEYIRTAAERSVDQ
jgi:hypothetical protein